MLFIGMQKMITLQYRQQVYDFFRNAIYCHAAPVFGVRLCFGRGAKRFLRHGMERGKFVRPC